ncbi:MAG: Ig-like domain-containing protein [Planctomycetota bacterium]
MARLPALAGLALCLCLSACSPQSTATFPGSSETSPSTLVSSSPTDGARDVETDVRISVEFSRPMRAASFDLDSFLVDSEGEPIPGSVAASSRFASFVPKKELPAGKSIRVMLTRAILDEAGRPIESELELVFETLASSPRLSLETISPGPGQVDVPVDLEVIADFNRELAPDSIDNGTLQVIAPGGVSWPGVVSHSGRRLSWKATSLLSDETTYVVRIDSDLRSTDGAELGEPIELDIRTGRLLQVVQTEPASHASGASRTDALKIVTTVPVDPGSIDDATFHIQSADGDAIPGRLEVAGNEISFDPEERLAPGVTYQAMLSGSLRTSGGRELGEDYLWQFTTDPRLLPWRLYGFLTDEDGPDRIAGLGLEPDGALTDDLEVIETSGTSDFLRVSTALILSPDGRFLFSAHQGSHDISSFEIRDDGSLIPVVGSPFPCGGQGPTSLVISPDGRRLFVNCSLSQQATTLDITLDGKLSVRAVSEVLPFTTNHLAIGPSGRYLMIGTYLGFQIREILPDGQLSFVAEVPTEDQPTALAVSPDGRYFLGVERVDTRTHVTRAGTWDSLPNSPFAGFPGTSSAARAIFTGDGRFLFVASQVSYDLVAYRQNPTGELHSLPGYPLDTGGFDSATMAITEDGLLYITGRTSLVAPWRVSAHAIQPDGQVLQVGNRESLAPADWSAGLVILNR